MSKQNYTVQDGGHVDVCVQVNFTSKDAKALSDAGITQKRTILDLANGLPCMVTLGAEIHKGLMAIAADPVRRREVARLKAESQMEALKNKLARIAEIETAIQEETEGENRKEVLDQLTGKLMALA